MKRITLLFAVLTAVVINVAAQFLPPATDVYLKHTQTGMVSDVAPYSTGFVYISNDGTNDVVSFTTDGAVFTDADVLEAGTGLGLQGWGDNDVAYYLGNNTTDAVGVELRKLEGGSADYIEDYNPFDQTLGAGSGVLRAGSGPDYTYHFMVANGADLFGGPTYAPAYTGGLIYNELFDAQFVPQILDYNLHGTMFNGSLYYAGAIGSGWITNPTVYKAATDGLTSVHVGGSDQFFGFKATTANMYFLNGFYGDVVGGGGLYLMNTAELVEPVLDPNELHVNVVDEIEMQILDENLYAVAKLDPETNKLAKISGATVMYYNLNDAAESDNIVDMVVSGDYVYVLAQETGGNTELYAINPSREDAKFVLASGLGGNYGTEQGMLTAIDGGVAFISDTGSSNYIFVADGNDGNCSFLMVDGGPVLDIKFIKSTGDKLYLFSNNGTDTEIYEYVVKEFATLAKTITVQESETATLIEGASVIFDSGLETYTGSTDVNGLTTITAPYGYLMAHISASGYASIEQEYYVGAFNGNPTYELVPAKSFAFVVFDGSVHNPIMGGGELAGATVTLVNDDNTYTVLTDSDAQAGYANFDNIAIGEYTYTVTMDGFETQTGSFTVDASTMGGPFIVLTPVATRLPVDVVAKVSVYPNPAKGLVQINSAADIVSVKVYNATGSLVKAVSGVGVTSIQVSDLPSGVYILKTKDVDGAMSTLKLQKQ